MRIVLILALLGIAASQPDYYTGRHYTERARTGPTTEPRVIRDMLDLDAWGDVNRVIEDHEEPVGGRDHYWDNDIRDPVVEHIIPELCNLTPDNCTVYNSYLLDCNCVKEFESVSPECRSFKCDAVHYFLEHGADIFAKFVRSGSIKEAIQVVHKELTSIFEDLNVCTCGKEFFKAAFTCAPFYGGNALTTSYAEDVVYVQRVLRNVDFKSLSRVFDRVIDGMCVETSGGRCLNSIFTGLEEVAEIVENTISDYEDYDDGDKKYQKKQEKRCDAVFGPIKAWDKSKIEVDDLDGEEDVEQLFSKTAVFMNSFYCGKGCKKGRSSVYPCCLRILLEDKKLFNAIERVAVSIYRIVPALDSYFDGYFDGTGELERRFTDKYNLEEILAWTVPETIRDAIMRTIHAAKYCEGKPPKCFN